MHNRKYVHTVGWPALATLLTVVSGMAFSLWWPAVVRHKSFYWLTPGDAWTTVRTAHYVGWGALSYVYQSRAAFVTLPAFATLLTPIVALTSHLGLSEASPGILLYKPAAWLIIGPFFLLMSGIGLFGLDTLTRRVGIGPQTRIGLTLGEAIVLWPTIALWGHPEDVIAVGLIGFALVAMIDGRWALAAWLLGGAIAMQLLALLVIPIFLGVAGLRRAAPLLARACVLPGFFAVAVLIPDYHDATKVLLKQPGYPLINHPTPWLALSPVIGPHIVAAGPSRVLAGAFALLAGWYASRHRDDLLRILIATGGVLVARCAFESIIVPYYVMPPLAFLFVAAYQLGRIRALIGFIGALAVTVMTHYHLRPWFYYSEMMSLFAVVLLVVAIRPPRPLAVDLLCENAAVTDLREAALEPEEENGRVVALNC